MKINIIGCSMIIVLCAQLLIVTSFAVENKLSTSVKKNLDNHAVTTVVTINPIEKESSKSRVDHEVKDMVSVSKKSQGKKGSGGGNNVVRDPSGTKKNDAVSKLPQTMSFYISVCLFLVLSF